MKKNEIIKLNITDIGINGEGIGKYDGFTFFVKNSVPGDEVEALITKINKNYGYAKKINILSPGEHRVIPACAVAEQCGGCQIMQLSYQKQLELKEQRVIDNLERIGKLNLRKFSEEDSSTIKTEGTISDKADRSSLIYPILGIKKEPFEFRNKVQFPIGKNKEGKTVAGFYAGRTHFIVETESCAISPEGTNILIKTICNFADEYNLSVYNEMSGDGLLRHALIRSGFRTGQLMICLVINGQSLGKGRNGEDLDKEFVRRILELKLPDLKFTGQRQKVTGVLLNVNRKNTNVILGEEIINLYGNSYIEDIISLKQNNLHDLRFKISPLSFYQVNPLQTERLYSRVMEFADLKGHEVVWDLYSGIGTIALFLAQKAKKVYGVEIVERAVLDAKENAKINKITNAEFFCGDSARIFEEKATGTKVDVVVLDPPRKGCSERLLKAVKKIAPEKIVYVSCDPATLARDLAILRTTSYEAEYKVKEIQPVDMFCHTVHVECVVSLSRK